jgi:hypothetical protein
MVCLRRSAPSSATSRPRADAASERIAADERRVARLEAFGIFGVRPLLVLAMLVDAYALLGRLRTRGSPCPYCGFPGRPEQHCEGCGHALLTECAACGGPRRIGTPHCGTCGSG